MDSTKLRCNTGLNVSPQARTLDMSTNEACETRALGTELCDTVAHPTASTSGRRKMRHGHSASWYTRAAGHRRAWLDPSKTHHSWCTCSTVLLEIIANPSLECLTHRGAGGNGAFASSRLTLTCPA